MLPSPASYPSRGVIAATMIVRLSLGAGVPEHPPNRCHAAAAAGKAPCADDEADGGELFAIHYTTDGEPPTHESKMYTTPIFLTEDGQACQFAASEWAAARGASESCEVVLRAIAIPRSPDRCLARSEEYRQTFHVLSA